MPRLRYIEDHEIGPGQRWLLDLAERTGAPDKRIISIWTRAQAGVVVMGAWANLVYEGLLPNRIKEMCRIRISEAHHCGYCSTVRSTVAQEEGLTEAMVADLWDPDSSDKFTAREKAALRFAGLFKSSDDAIDNDGVFADLRTHFSEEEIIELGLVCSLTDGLGKFAKAMNIVTWDEACQLNPALRDRAAQVETGVLGG